MFLNHFHSLQSHIIWRFTHIVPFSLVDPGLLVARGNSSQDRSLSSTDVLPSKISRLREVLLLVGIDCPVYKLQKSVRVQILRESRYTESLVEQRFIPEFLSPSKFQDFLRFTKIFQAKLSLQNGCIYTKL